MNPGEGTMAGETRTFDDGNVWVWQGHTNVRYQCWIKKGDDRVAPAVMCACGETRFQITYGSYECLAVCPCGREFILYDG